MKDLNPRQQEAVETIEGPLLVLAGAGSGKTRVITCRIAYLIEHAAVQPWQILAVTFTNKAAGEMKSRVEAELSAGLRTSSPLISTFHSLCVRILRRNIEALNAGYTRSFTIYDQDDQVRVVRQTVKDLDIDDKALTARQALGAISGAKNRGTSPAGYANHASQGEYVTDRNEKISRIFKLYEERLQKANALDFDDLLIKAVELLRRVTEIRQKYHNRYRHVMIDEFQDTNGIQYELARLIAVGSTKTNGAVDAEELWKERSLCVVGDIDQSIYSFRGSDFNIILGFQHDFVGTKMIKLEQNYRSTQTILEAANKVIECNRQRLPKTLFATPELGQGEKIRYYQAYDAEAEAAFVGDRIVDHQRQSYNLRSVVLYRTNAQSRLFEEALRRRGIAYNIVGGFSFYDRAEVKDIIAYLKLAMNAQDDIAMARVINAPPRGIGKTTIDLIQTKQAELGLSVWETIDLAVSNRALGPRATTALEGFTRIIRALRDRVSEGQPLSEIVRAATLDTGYVRSLEEEKSVEAEGRLLNIEELVTAAVEAEEQGESLQDFIDHAALVADTDQYKADARVTLMTMHSAKGLEFPLVFIVGLEEGLFPHSRASASEEDLEEERRLCYVAITRAQKDLYITHAMQRRIFGEEDVTEPSRFLNELPLELMQNLSQGSSWLGFAERAETRQNREAAAALRGEPSRAVKKTSNYAGKTYNSVDGVREFFKSRTTSGGGEAGERRSGGAEGRRRKGAEAVRGPAAADSGGQFLVGARVKHAKYGFGVVLRSEGAGDDAKLTVSFPGYGQKKFVAKFAALEKA
ncbi:MAG TPA: UvrD-helicase domain-containing protein [Blastocatellia bacterium]|nr:UvrD-helicase domain-containing protein [Blastocatellia bacterium]